MSLKQELKARLINDMVNKAKEASPDVPGLVVLVDPHTSGVLSSCLRMHELTEAGVLALQNINLRRERLPGVPAIYFIQPTEENVAALSKDFAQDQYACAHLFFTGHVSDGLMGSIGSDAKLLPRIKSFVELNTDFIAKEPRVFSLDQSGTIPKIYFPGHQGDRKQVFKSTAEKISSVLLTMNELPYVRYMSNGPNNNSETLANMVVNDMKRKVSSLETWQQAAHRERGTLLILDRSFDAVAPLLHEFTYQAMINDLLNVKGELIYLDADQKERQDGEDAIAQVLSANDDLWMRYKDQHVAKVMSQVSSEFRAFKAENKAAQLHTSGGDASTKELLKAVKDLPKYREQMKKFNKHMNIASACSRELDSQQLADLGEFEQDMATGTDKDGRKVKDRDLIRTLIDKCRDSSVSTLTKLRLVMIYIISRKGIEEDARTELLKSIDPGLKRCVSALAHLGVDLSTNDHSHKSAGRKELLEKLRQSADRNCMRYLPELHTIFSDLVSGQLDQDDFPYSGTPPPSSGRSRKAKKSSRTRNWRSKGGNDNDEKKGDGVDDSKPRFIVYIIGGMTFSEIRSLNEVVTKQGANLYLGSSDTLIAAEYVRDLCDLTNADFKGLLGSAGNLNAPISLDYLQIKFPDDE